MHHLVTLKIFYLIHLIGVSTLPALLQASIPLSGSFLPRWGVAHVGVVGSGVRSQSPAWSLCSRHFRSVFCLKILISRHLCTHHPLPHFISVFTYATMLYSVCVCQGVVGWGGAVSVHRHPCITMRESTPSRLVNIFFDFILAAIEWAHRDSTLWFSVSHTHTPQPPHSPLFPTTVRNNQQCFSSCTWFVHKPYFEYNACKTRCLNQTYEDTNLHLLSVWRGLPYRNEGPGFPIQLKASQVHVANDKNWIQFLFFLGGWGLFWDPGSVLNSFSAHYATLLCFLCIGCCCYHRWCVRQEQNFHCVWGRVRLRPDFYLLIHNVFFYGVDLEHLLLPLDLFLRKKDKKITEYRTFFFLTLLLWSARPSLKCVERQTEHGGKLWC